MRINRIKSLYNRVNVVNTILCTQKFVKTVDFMLSSYSNNYKNKTRQQQRDTRKRLEVMEMSFTLIVDCSRRCFHMYKLTKLCTLNMCGFCYQLYLSESSLKNIIISIKYMAESRTFSTNHPHLCSLLTCSLGLKIRFLGAKIQFMLR